MRRSTFDQLGAIGEAGEHIIVRHVFDLLLRLSQFGNVVEGRHPAAALLYRLIVDAKRAPGRCLYYPGGRLTFACIGKDLRENPPASLASATTELRYVISRSSSETPLSERTDRPIIAA